MLELLSAPKTPHHWDLEIRWWVRQPHHRWHVTLCLCLHPTANTKQFGWADFLGRESLAPPLSERRFATTPRRETKPPGTDKWNTTFFTAGDIFWEEKKSTLSTFSISILFFCNPFVIRREWAEYVAADYAAVILGPIRNTVIFLKNLVIKKLLPNLAFSEISVGEIRFQ